MPVSKAETVLKGHPPYDGDFFAWTQDQADALRQLTKESFGNRLDIAHIAEEIEDLGKRDLREVESFLARFFEHLIKMSAYPESLDQVHWRAEARTFRRDAAATFSPSMRQVIDIDRVWRRGRKDALDFLADVGRPSSLDAACPFALDDLLGEEFDLDIAQAKLFAAWNS